MSDVEKIISSERHTPGNAAAMREALLIVKRLFDGRIMFHPDIRKAHKAVDAALSAPPRQCDVGTPDEQGVRCLATMRYWRKAYRGDALITAIMKWAHESYMQEGGADNGI